MADFGLFVAACPSPYLPVLPNRPTSSPATSSAITFPESLPVSGKRDEIEAALRVHQVIIVCGETLQKCTYEWCDIRESRCGRTKKHWLFTRHPVLRPPPVGRTADS